MLKPGDMIEWTYKSNSKVVVTEEEIWSTPLERWVPIGGDMVHLLISITGDTIVWLNSKGLFHARVDDTLARLLGEARRRVVPREHVVV